MALQWERSSPHLSHWYISVPLFRAGHATVQVGPSRGVLSGNGVCGMQPISAYVSSSSSFQMFKGPDKDIEFIYTAPSSAVCGVSLDVGGKKEYLIAGVSVGVAVGCSGDRRGGRRGATQTPRGGCRDVWGFPAFSCQRIPSELSPTRRWHSSWLEQWDQWDLMGRN